VNKKARTRLIVAMSVLLVALIGGVLWWVVTQGDYSKRVADLKGGDLDGKSVRVSGRVQGPLSTPDASGYHFVIKDLEGSDETVAVVYNGQMPETFAVDVDVIVIGKYSAADHLITADRMETKCPSKYEGQSASPQPQSTQP